MEHVTSDRLRWWIIGIVLGAAAMACASLAADVGAGADDTPLSSSSTPVLAERITR